MRMMRNADGLSERVFMLVRELKCQSPCLFGVRLRVRDKRHCTICLRVYHRDTWDETMLGDAFLASFIEEEPFVQVPGVF